MNPRYTHDCEECTFLGQFQEYDLYVCPVSLLGGTYIVRYSSDGPDYQSGKVFVGKFPPITEAHRLATVQGLALDLGF